MVQKANLAIKVYGAGALQRNLGALRKEIPGILRTRDIEHVHRMRVAARRLATILTAFHDHFPTKRVKTWEKEIRHLTRILGRARDLDIQVLNIKAILNQVSEVKYRAGIRRLWLRSVQQRNQVQSKLEKALSALEKNQAISSMEIHANLVVARQGTLKKSAEADLQAFGLKAIGPAMIAFLEYDPFVDRVKAVKELHAMRLAAKRLRYTLECFLPVFSGRFEEELSVLRTVQELLGVIHDCDVWGMNRQELIENERCRTIKYLGSDRAMSRLLPGLEYFFDQLGLQRQQKYAEFVRFWRGLRKDHYWDRVAHRLDLSIPKPAGKRDPGSQFKEGRRK